MMQLSTPAQPCCPRCGGDIQAPIGTSYDAEKGTLEGADYSVRFTKREGAIFELLWRRRRHGAISRDAIHDHLYADDPDGGPLDPCIKVYIWKMRCKLRGTDIQIVTDYHRGYWLQTNIKGAS